MAKRCWALIDVAKTTVDLTGELAEFLRPCSLYDLKEEGVSTSLKLATASNILYRLSGGGIASCYKEKVCGCSDTYRWVGLRNQYAACDPKHTGEYCHQAFDPPPANRLTHKASNDWA